jgi:hypothetical protein
VQFTHTPLSDVNGVKHDVKRQKCPCEFTPTFSLIYDFTHVYYIAANLGGFRKSIDFANIFWQYFTTILTTFQHNFKTILTKFQQHFSTTCVKMLHAMLDMSCSLNKATAM